MKRIELATAAVLLTLLLGCGQSKETGGETKPPAPSAPPAEVATTPAPAAAPAPAEPAPAATTPAVAGMVRYEAQPSGSHMKIEGDSTIHAWHMESAVLGGFLEVDAKFPEAAATGGAKAEVFMPVRSFKSGNKKMDEVMQDAMKEGKFKKIEYKLTSLVPKAGAAGQFEATGSLTIAGETKPLVMTVSAEKIEGTKLKITGKASFKMSDYGVTPPAPKIAMGLIKTEDSVTNSFEWLVAPKAQ